MRFDNFLTNNDGIPHCCKQTKKFLTELLWYPTSGKFYKIGTSITIVVLGVHIVGMVVVIYYVMLSNCIGSGGGGVTKPTVLLSNALLVIIDRLIVTGNTMFFSVVLCVRESISF